MDNHRSHIPNMACAMMLLMHIPFNGSDARPQSSSLTMFSQFHHVLVRDRSPYFEAQRLDGEKGRKPHTHSLTHANLSRKH